jgi:DNA-binding response OmpR family regulator
MVNAAHTASPSTLLIVDDDAATREGLAQMLAGAGYRVITADTFARAQQSLKTNKPDLLIADVRLGDFNGLQLIATSPFPIRAIVVTGFADAALERDARQLGAEYLIKPITRAALLDLIERQLRQPLRATAERRWRRKRLAAALSTTVNRSPARLLDVSYGGMRLQVDNFPEELPQEFAVTLPDSDRLVHVEVVWKIRQQDHAWLCGAELAEANTLMTSAWRDLVDAV